MATQCDNGTFASFSVIAAANGQVNVSEPTHANYSDDDEESIDGE
jgi:hypothetical protein